MISRSKFRVLIVYPNLTMMLMPSYAIGLFTSILKKSGYEVDLFDSTSYSIDLPYHDGSLPIERANKLCQFRKFDADSILGHSKATLKEDFIKKIEDFKPHVVIFSTVVEDTWPLVKDLLKILKHYPEIKYIIGGIFTTMAPHIAIEHSLVTIIGVGEGEQTVIDFCEAVRKDESYLHIPGTWVKDDENKIIRNPSRPLQNINDIMPDFSLFDDRRFQRPLGGKVYKAIPVETYRGCPYTCTFCNSPQQVVIARENKQGYFLRRKKMDVLKKEIELQLDRLNANCVMFFDDAFMARSPQEILQFSEMYTSIHIPFWFQTRFEDIQEYTLEALLNVGLLRISFGLEHGNFQFRKEKLFRNITNEKIIQKAKILTQVGLPYTVNVIIGFPYETRKLVFETIDLCKQMDSFDSINVNIFAPYHGTALREMALKEKWLDPTAPTSSIMGRSMLRMPPPYLSAEDIMGLQRVFPLYVRMPEERYPEIDRAEKLDPHGRKIYDHLSEEFYEKVYQQSEEDRMLTYQG